MLRFGGMRKEPRSENEVRERFESIGGEVEAAVDGANKLITEELPSPLMFKYSMSAPKPLLDESEQAQTLCFVAKYVALPEMEPVDIRLHKGRFYPNNIDYYRHLLNEFRSVVQNENDSTHFNNINALCRRFLRRKPEQGLSLSVSHDGADVTEAYSRLLNQRVQAVRLMVGACDFGYIYNGILQHSDHSYTARYMAEYASGELHYVFIRHALMCTAIKGALESHFYALSNLQSVNMGSL